MILRPKLTKTALFNPISKVYATLVRTAAFAILSRHQFIRLIFFCPGSPWCWKISNLWRRPLSALCSTSRLCCRRTHVNNVGHWTTVDPYV